MMAQDLEELIAAAKAWRGMVGMQVSIAGQNGVETVTVRLGEGRRKWKHLAGQLGQLDVVLARGFDEAGAMVGQWDAGAMDEEAGESEAGETENQSQHRLHTQWVLREASKMHETSQRLCVELVGAVIEVLKYIRPTSAATEQQAPDDEASRTLGLLLQSVLNQRGGDHAEEKPDDRRKDGSADRQGQQGEQDNPGT